MKPVTFVSSFIAPIIILALVSTTFFVIGLVSWLTNNDFVVELSLLVTTLFLFGLIYLRRPKIVFTPEKIAVRGLFGTKAIDPSTPCVICVYSYYGVSESANDKSPFLIFRDDLNKKFITKLAIYGIWRRSDLLRLEDAVNEMGLKITFDKSYFNWMHKKINNGFEDTDPFTGKKLIFRG